MSNLRQQIRSSLHSFIKQHDGEHVPVDILRVIEQEAMLLKETTEVQDMFLADDPFQILKNNEMSRGLLEPFVKSLRVVDCSRQRVGHDNCRIDAVVEVDTSKVMSGGGGNLTLTFRYVRQPRKENSAAADGDDMDVGDGDHEIQEARSSSCRKSQPCHVWYSIEVSNGPDRPKENLLVVEIFAPKSVPTLDRPPVCINNDDNDDGDSDDDEEDGWEDIDDEDLDQIIGGEENTKLSPSSKSSKRRKLSTGGSKDNSNDNGNEGHQGEEDDENEDDGGAVLGSTSTSPTGGLPTTHDSYIAYLDPDLLHEFVAMNFNSSSSSSRQQHNHSSMDEATAFFILMTFPFYEHEWDIVGMVLDEVFGHEDGENDDVDGDGDGHGDDEE